MTTVVLTKEASLVENGGPGVEETTTVSDSVAGWLTIGSAVSRWQPEPILYGPGSVVLNLGSMAQGKAYALTFAGAELVAVKAKDGSVTFYEVPQK